PPPSPAPDGIRFTSRIRAGSARPAAASSARAAVSTRLESPIGTLNPLVSRLVTAAGSSSTRSWSEIACIKVETSWRPSGRRPNTLRSRFSFAWAGRMRALVEVDSDQSVAVCAPGPLVMARGALDPVRGGARELFLDLGRGARRQVPGGDLAALGQHRS